MADEETETNIFGDGVENRGVDDDDEIEMRNLNPYDSSSQAWFRRHNLSLFPFKNLRRIKNLRRNIFY